MNFVCNIKLTSRFQRNEFQYGLDKNLFIDNKISDN